jgi:hypothetical protein
MMEETIYTITVKRTVTRQKTGKGYYNVRDEVGNVEQKYIDTPVGIMEETEQELIKVKVTDLDQQAFLEVLTKIGKAA